MIEQSITEFLLREGYVVSGFSGVSMMPMLDQRTDRLLILRVQAPVKKNDVVLYRRGDRLILHRVLRVSGERLVIRGDNCIRAERDMTQRDILGMLSAYWQGERYFECTDEWNAELARQARKTYLRRLLVRVCRKLRRICTGS